MGARAYRLPAGEFVANRKSMARARAVYRGLLVASVSRAATIGTAWKLHAVSGGWLNEYRHSDSRFQQRRKRLVDSGTAAPCPHPLTNRRCAHYRAALPAHSDTVSGLYGKSVSAWLYASSAWSETDGVVAGYPAHAPAAAP